MTISRTRLTLAALTLAAGFGLGAASAQESVMKQCGDKWQAAKAANQVPAGQTWPKFLSECRAQMAAQPAATAPAAPAPAPAATAPAAPKPAAPPAAAAASPKPSSPLSTVPAQPMAPAATAAAPAAGAKPATGGRAGMLAREKQCSGEWKTYKDQHGGKPEAGVTWPKFWSQCNTRLKAAGM